MVGPPGRHPKPMPSTGGHCQHPSPPIPPTQLPGLAATYGPGTTILRGRSQDRQSKGASSCLGQGEKGWLSSWQGEKRAGGAVGEVAAACKQQQGAGHFAIGSSGVLGGNSEVLSPASEHGHNPLAGDKMKGVQRVVCGLLPGKSLHLILGT